MAAHLLIKDVYTLTTEEELVHDMRKMAGESVTIDVFSLKSSYGETKVAMEAVPPLLAEELLVG